MSWSRRILIGVTAVVAVGVVVLLVGFRRQTISFLTHWKGPPEDVSVWQPVAGPDLHLVAVGDTGEPGRHLDANAAAMATLGEAAPVDLLWLLGDNVYPDGDPRRLPAMVFDPFADLLAQGTDLQAILGNHDVRKGHGEEQMRALDMDGRWWARERGGVLMVGLDSNAVDDPDQLEFLERTLSSSTAGWKIVAVHHPPYSAGYQGSDVEVRDTFGPVFARHGVQLVLSGHDHDYQRSEVIDGVTYVVSGAGSGARRTGEEEFTEVSFAWLHFVEIAAFDDHLVVRAVGGDPRHLEVADEFVLHR